MADLHPVIARTIDAAHGSVPPLSKAGLGAARRALEESTALLGAGPDVFGVGDVGIPTPRGRDVTARWYWGAEDPAALIMYVHGGGWSMGSLDAYDALVRALATATSALVLSVHYALAPENPFPEGLDDVRDALRWAAAESKRRALPLIVAGDSAGANLALAAQLSSDLSAQVQMQLLLYPVVDSDFNTTTYQQYAESLMIRRSDMMWFFHNYAPMSAWADGRISILNSPGLAGLPPTWIACAEYDVLRSEAELLRERLDAAGVPVTLTQYPGVTHGFLRLFNSVDVARDTIADLALAVAATLAPHTDFQRTHPEQEVRT